MKGVVRPQAMPTRRKPRVSRNSEGGGTGGSESIGFRFGFVILLMMDSQLIIQKIWQ